MPRMLRFLGILTAFVVAGAFTGLAAQEETPPDTVILEGAPLGDVTFVHSAHQNMTECVTCHHESRTEQPASSAYQPCSACHTRNPTPPMTTSIRDAFHDARAQAGTCITCHLTKAEAGETVPLRCNECHVRKSP